MSEDLKTLVAQEVQRQLAAATPNEDVLKTLRFLTAPPVVTVTESRALTVNDFNRLLLFVTSASAANSIELTLPPAADCVGKQIAFLNIGAQGSLLTLKPNGTEEFFGNLWSVSTHFLDLRNGSSVTLTTDGINWMVVNGGTVDAVVEGGGYVNDLESGWYKKLQSGMVWMGGTVNLNGATSKTISLPTNLKAGDWPVVTITPLWEGTSGIPQVSYDFTTTTSFILYSTKSAVVTWHAYGYWR